MTKKDKKKIKKKMLNYISDSCTLNEIQDYAKKTDQVDDLFVRKQKLTYVFPTFEFFPNVDRFTGGTNGRLIGYYQSPGLSSYGSRIVNFYDHKLNKVDSLSLPYDTKNAWIYLTSYDYLVALTQHQDSLTSDVYFHGRLVNSSPIELKSEETVSDVQFWENGFVFVTSMNRVIHVHEFSQPKLLFKIESEEQMTKIIGIPPDATKSGHPTVYVTGFEPVVYVGTQSKYHAVDLPGSITYFKIHPKYNYIAFLIDGTQLVITTSDLSSNLCAYDITNENKSPLSFDWLGDMILVGFSGEIWLCTCNENIQMYDLPGDSSPLVFSSSEHALVFTQTKLIQFSIVPQKFIDASTPGHPGYQLLEAMINKSPRILDEMNKQDKLYDAIQQCIKASKECINKELMQKTFMLAAIFGNSFLNDNQLKFKISNTIQSLRVMNSLQNDLNIFMTPKEIYHLIGTVSYKYSQNELFDVAHEIATFTGASRSPIVTDWCCFIIKNFTDDNEAFKIISSRKNDSFDPTEVAKAADNLGRKALANMISSLEQYPAKLIGFFIQSGNWESALNAALRSMDSIIFFNAVRTIIIKNKDAVRDFFMKHPQAISIVYKFKQYREDSDPIIDLLSELPLSDSTLYTTLLNFSGELSKDNLEPIKTAAQKIHEMEKQNQKNDTIANYSLLANYSSSYFKAIEKSSGKGSVNIPINKAIESTLLNNGLDAAEKLAKEAGLTEKRYQVIIARSAILNGRKDLYSKLAEKYVNIANLIASMILASPNLSSTIDDFISLITKEKERNKLKQLRAEGKLDYTSFDMMNDDYISDRILFSTPLIGH